MDRRRPYQDDGGRCDRSAAEVARDAAGRRCPHPHGRSHRCGACPELGVAALDVGLAAGRASLGAARTSGWVGDVQVATLLAPVSSPAVTRPTSRAVSRATGLRANRSQIVVLPWC